MRIALSIGLGFTGIFLATNCLSAELKVGGGGAACSGFFAPAADSFQAETGNVMRVMPSTPGMGLIELSYGIVDVAAAAVPLEEMLKGAAVNGINLDAEQFRVTEIGENRTMIFTHKTNNVKSLTKKQLKDIFTGKISNWSDVGGGNQEIVVVWGIATPGQNDLFSRHILDGEPVTQKRKSVTDYRMIKAYIEKTPGAIGINPEGFVSSRTNNPSIPVITSKVIAVTKGKGSVDVDNLIQFVKEYARK